MKQLIKKRVSSLMPGLYSGFRLRQLKGSLPAEILEEIATLDSSSLAVDVGANIGLVSELIARTGATVHSFEPNRQAFQQLRKTAARFPNMTINNVAAGVKDQEVVLYLHKNSGTTDDDLTQASSLKADKPNVSTEYSQKVNEIDFALYLNGLDRTVDILKIDIEGYEIELVNHLLDCGAFEKVRKVYVETHERKYKALKESTDNMKRRVTDAGLGDKFFFDWH